MSETDPDIWFLGTTAVQLPLDWLAERQPWIPGDLPGLKAVAQEVAPGVRVTVLGTGDCLLPDGQVRSGAQVAVWRDAERTEDGLTRDELSSFLAEGMHTAFRKAVDSETSALIWRLIRDMPDEDWARVITFVSEPVADQLDGRGWAASNTSSRPERLMRRLRGFLIEGLENGGTEARCWHCGVARTFGGPEDGVLVADVAAWCDSHVCPGLAVT